MRVIGTAGHVDHGKSTLVAALTGINPDRLKEEQLRQMTIELGFAWLTLPNGEEVGIVDVPGHRDFIENMLAGVGGIDAALLVIAADEGVMPQTREHLAILDLLQIKGGVVTLTKIDMIDDPDWLDLVELDVRAVLNGTVLQDAPVMRVSARTGEGLPALTAALSEVLADQPQRADLGRPRLPIDRVFTIAGFGTVVTGTLSDGVLKIGDEIEILPAGRSGRIRGLQSHKRKEQSAVPGSRTAANISGIAVDEVRRGDVLTHPGQYRNTHRLDLQLRLLPDVSAPLHHFSEVKLFIAASEVLARVRLLGVEELAAGETGWIQVETQQPVVAVRGDRYILRRPSPGETLGGGVVIDPFPPRRHKRFDAQVIERLEAIRKGTPADVLYQASLAVGAASIRELVTHARLSPADAQTALRELIQNRQFNLLKSAEASLESEQWVMPASLWNSHTQKVINEVTAYHKNYPLRLGMPRQELASRLKLQPRLFNLAVAQWRREGIVVEKGGLIASPDHRVRFDPRQQATIEQMRKRFSEAPYAPPSIKDLQSELGEEVVAALIEQGELVAVSSEVAFQKQIYQQLVEEVTEHLRTHQTLTAAQFRDRYQTSRRYALALLEHLDAIGLTVRQGDEHRLRE